MTTLASVLEASSARGGGAVNSPATVAPSSSTSSLTGPAVFAVLDPDVPPGACADDSAALTGALGLVVEGSAIE